MATNAASSVRISVRVKPRASRTRILQAEGFELVVALAAPPVDGAANTALIELLAAVLGRPKSALRLVVGQTSKQKVVEVTGVEPAEVARCLQASASAHG